MDTPTPFQALAIDDESILLEDGDLTDPIFIEIFDEMDMTNVEDQRKFVMGCRLSFTKWQHELNRDPPSEEWIKHEDRRECLRVNFNDWKTLVALVVKTGCSGFSSKLGLGSNIIRYNHKDSRFWGTSYYYLKGGCFEDLDEVIGYWNYSTLVGHDRICFLELTPNQELTPDHFPFCKMPTCICRLDYLKELSLECFDDINLVLPLTALCSLPRLEILHFLDHGTIDVTERNWKEQGFVFPHLKILQITSTLTFNILEMCPSLRQLDLCMHEKSEVDRYLKILSSSNCGFAELLEKLRVHLFTQDRLCLDRCQTETLLFQVVPRFPNLRALDFSCPKVKVMVEILKSKSNDLETINPSKSLQFVSIYFQDYFQISEQIGDGMIESFQKFVNTLNTVENMSFYYGYDFLCFSWEYAMIQNMAGRRLLEGNGVRGGANSLPLSVWPILIQRIQRKIDEEAREGLWQRLGNGVTKKPKNFRANRGFWARILHSSEEKTSAKATGIYYLLREGMPRLGTRG